MVYMFFGTGFEETEAIAPLDLLRRAGIAVTTVGLNGPIVSGSHDIAVVTDMIVEQLDISDAEMIILPGGLGGVASIRNCKPAMDAIRAVWEAGKYTAAICAGPTVLAELGITQGRRATCYPGCEDRMGGAILVKEAAVQDGMLITGTSAGCAVPFGLKLIEALKGKAEADRIAEQIVIR